MTEILTFGAAGAMWGVPLSAVHEVIAVPPVTHLPLAPESVAGIIDIRGAAVAAIDFAAIVGNASPARHSAIVLGRAALLVDTVYDVIEVDSLRPVDDDRFAWADGVVAQATVVNPARLLEAIQ